MNVMDRDQTIEFLRQHVKTEMLMSICTPWRPLCGDMPGIRRRRGHLGHRGLTSRFRLGGLPHPEDHPQFGAQILRDHGCPEEMVRAVLTHGDHTGIPRESLMEHTLYAVDELSGFIRAVTLVRPSKSLGDVAPRSVRRKMKDKAFARDVNRDDIVRGAEELGVELDEHIAFIVDSMKPIASQIDLVDEPAQA